MGQQSVKKASKQIIPSHSPGHGKFKIFASFPSKGVMCIRVQCGIRKQNHPRLFGKTASIHEHAINFTDLTIAYSTS